MFKLVCDPFLNTEITLGILKLLGTMPVEKEVLNKTSRGLDMTVLRIRNIETGILKGPVASPLFNLNIYFSISSALVEKR